ncbi:MAG: Na/Pi cotransporter family protein [Ruminococcaceae bacterium]|nr:Na/Pi cotransporter family protein [Oscillospiraceae bacterium]
MDIFMVLALIGGLVMFLYGMDLMGDGLKKLAGGKLESILAKLTSNRFKGFLLGFGVTAIIQSSSATTVMLVGFVNSGIMKLGQTIGIILGANVGTTVTSWLLSTAGIGEGGSMIMKFFKPESFTPLLALLGFLMIASAKNDRRKNTGTILVGFAILMFGMEAMGDSVAALKDNEAFTSLLTMFGNNPIMGILVGTLFTAIIQSSSASVGVLQALALTCAIPYSTAIPLVLGMNIGTTITPIISSVSGNTESKRVAFSCLYIKMIGVAVVAGAFYIINAFVGFDFLKDTASAFNIAVVHTLFNIVSTVILLPFCSLFEKLAIATIKGKKDEETDTFSVLDDRFLDMPSFAVEKSKDLVCEMANISNESFRLATKLLDEYDDDTFNKVKKLESKVDKYEDKISTYLVKVAEKQIAAKESRVVTELLHCIGDIERISDHALNIAEVAQEISEKKIDFSDKAKQDIKIITAAVTEVLYIAIEAMTNDDLDMAKCVEPLEQVIDRLKRKIKNGHITRLRQGDCTMELGFILSDLLTNYERIADHCSNIAVCFIEMSHDSFETHEYLNNLKSGDVTEFKEMYETYKAKYYME